MKSQSYVKKHVAEKVKIIKSTKKNPGQNKVEIMKRKILVKKMKKYQKTKK